MAYGKSYKADKIMKASKMPHMRSGSTTIVGPYPKKSGAQTFYKSKRGTNEGLKITIYSAPNSQKGKFGAVVRDTTRKYFHASSISELKQKLKL